MKVLKKIFLLGTIIILSIFNYVSGENIVPTGGFIDYSDEDMLIKSFDTTGGSFYQSNINFKSTIIDEFISMDGLYNLGEDIINKLNINKDLPSYGIDIANNSNYRKLTLWGEDH